MDFAVALQLIMRDPLLVLLMLLNIGVIIVNGATDASNAISTCIGTGAISEKSALLLAACGNYIGLMLMTLLTPAVANTISSLVRLGEERQAALLALAAAALSIIIWGVAAWSCGIPTSQSHSLIAGLSGAVLALPQGLAAINGAAWLKVIAGLLLSSVAGFALGLLITRLLGRQSAAGHRFRLAQIGAAAAMAVLHGAQDGQKFMGVMLISLLVAAGLPQEQLQFPLWLSLLCALTMAIGTAIGGRRIIRTVGQEMVSLMPYQGFAADMAACLCLLFSTLLGLPVSTTHTKTTAVMGVGAAVSRGAVDWQIARKMLLTWVFTFPGCGLLGYGISKLLLALI